MSALVVSSPSYSVPEALRKEGLSQADYDEIVRRLGRAPNRAELGMFGVMWSEHCCYRNSRPLLSQFPTSGPRVLVGPGENAGVVDLGEGQRLAFKIESHNHPSAVEPFQGAATGVGGILRDIFTMGARPIALLNALRFGPLDDSRNRGLMEGVVAGIAHYGNCVGVPTVGGEVAFDPSYSGNPLVNAMALGLMDSAVESIYAAVDARDVIDNTYFIFASDNGGCPTSGGRNAPLRGGKSTLFEGGTRVEAFFYSKKLDDSRKGAEVNGLFHVTDWFPTILDLAGVSTYSPREPVSGVAPASASVPPLTHRADAGDRALWLSTVSVPPRTEVAPE
jgi:hypothetical protein